MNDEIKEILEYWKFYINEPSNYKLLNVHFDEIKKVLDYITNLQQENERLKDNAIHNDKVVDKARWNEMIYKSRVEKAVKYNYELQERYCHSALYDELVASKIYEITEKELNILQNGRNKGE